MAYPGLALGRAGRRIDLRFFRETDGRQVRWNVKAARGYPLPEEVRAKVLELYPDDMEPHPLAAVLVAMEGEHLYLLDEAADPATPGKRIAELTGYMPTVRVGQRHGKTHAVAQAEEVRRAAFTNPSLPLDRLHLALLNAVQAAWHNPAVPLLLLQRPGRELVAAAVEALIRPHRYPAVRESIDETLGTLARHVDHQRRRGTVEGQGLARRLAELFSLP